MTSRFCSKVGRRLRRDMCSAPTVCIQKCAAGSVPPSGGDDLRDTDCESTSIPRPGARPSRSIGRSVRRRTSRRSPSSEVGVAILSGASEGSFEDRLRQFPALRERLGGATASSQVRGAGPLWQRVSHRTGGRVLLVGDAAGYVDALTGEGLAMGFRCADAALHASRVGGATDVRT